MWVRLRETPSLVTGEMWKEMLENQGVPVWLHVEPEQAHLGACAPRVVMIPKEKRRIAQEVLKETLQ
jgi:hypothetical protein